jgi:hypothetical protein
VSLAGSSPGHCDATAITVKVPPVFGVVDVFALGEPPHAAAIIATTTTAESAAQRPFRLIATPRTQLFC